MNVTVGNQAIVFKGVKQTAVQMLEKMYGELVVELVKTDSLDVVFNNGQRSWIVQEQNGWCVIEELSADSFILYDLLSGSGDFLDSVAYVFYVRQEKDIKFRGGAAYIGYYFGVYNPVDGKLEFMQKGLSIDKWEWSKSSNSHQLPISELSLNREGFEKFIEIEDIPISFGGREKFNPDLYIAKIPEKSDEEWAAFFEGFYRKS
jgi:hypothetical protein